MNEYKFYFFKTEDFFGNWKTFYNPSQNKLKKILNSNPKNLYVSLNKFLYYKEHNPSYRHQNMLLEKYNLIDIDGQCFNDREECKEYFIKILNNLSRQDIRIEEIIQTNNTVLGFHIIIEDLSLLQIYKLLEDEPNLLDKIDKNVFDLKRVCRPNFPTFNGNKNSWSIPFDIALGMPIEADDNEVCNTAPNKTTGRKANKSKLPSLPNTFFVKEISSSVLGTKGLYVPVIKFKNKPSEKRIKRIQIAYSLGDLYLFEYHMGYAAICPKTANMRRCEKIYKSFQSRKSLQELMKFKQNWIFVSNIFDIYTLKNIETLKFLGIYEQNAKGYYSNTHLSFLKKFYQKEYSNVIGRKPEIYIAEIVCSSN